MHLEKIIGTLKNYEIIDNQRGSGSSDTVGTLGVAAIIVAAVLGIGIQSCMESNRIKTEQEARQKRIELEHYRIIEHANSYGGSSPCMALGILEEAQRKRESDYTEEIKRMQRRVNERGALYDLGCSLGLEVDK